MWFLQGFGGLSVVWGVCLVGHALVLDGFFTCLEIQLFFAFGRFRVGARGVGLRG